MGQKTRPYVSKSFLMFIFTAPIILSDAEIYTAPSECLKILTCGSKISKITPPSKWSKNHHCSTFDDFFFHFG